MMSLGAEFRKRCNGEISNIEMRNTFHVLRDVIEKLLVAAINELDAGNTPIMEHSYVVNGRFNLYEQKDTMDEYLKLHAFLRKEDISFDIEIRDNSIKFKFTFLDTYENSLIRNAEYYPNNLNVFDVPKKGMIFKL